MSETTQTAEQTKAEKAALREQIKAQKEAERAANVAKIAAEREQVKAEKEARRQEIAQAKAAERERVKAERAEIRAAAEQEAQAERERKAAEKAARQAEGATTSSVVDQARYQYNSNGFKTGSGRKAVDCGDTVAVAIRGMSPDDVVALVPLNGGEVKEAWSLLNSGQRRMSAGNVLRRLLKTNGKLTLANGDEVTAPQAG